MENSIVVENLSKKFQLGLIHSHDLIQERLLNWIKRPFRGGSQRNDPNAFWALRNVSFSVAPGEVVGVIGRNGAGKSTLLKVLSKIIYPTSGNINIHGRIASLLEVGTGFHGELTGRENLFLNGSILGMTKSEIARKLDEIVAFAGVEGFLDTPVKRYSSGMFLRLGFAVAAHLEPDILLVDEVLAVGDAAFQKKCLDAMDEMRSGGRTVIFVSHNMAAVENLCSRAIWIDSGEVRADGAAKDVISQYMSSFGSETDLGCDLREVKNRRGNGNIRYTGIDFLDDESNPLTVFRTGDRLHLRLHYEAKQEISFPQFEVGVLTSLGTLLTRFSTYINYDIQSIPKGEGVIEMWSSPLNLIPNRYYLSLCLKSQGPVYYDVLEQVMQLDVESADIHGTGKGLERYFGITIVPCTWNLLNGKEVRSEDHSPYNE